MERIHWTEIMTSEEVLRSFEEKRFMVETKSWENEKFNRA